MVYITRQKNSNTFFCSLYIFPSYCFLLSATEYLLTQPIRLFLSARYEFQLSLWTLFLVTATIAFTRNGNYLSLLVSLFISPNVMALWQSFIQVYIVLCFSLLKHSSKLLFWGSASFLQGFCKSNCQILFCRSIWEFYIIFHGSNKLNT